MYFLTYCLITFISVASGVSDDEEKLIGWAGNSFNPRQKEPWVQTLSWTPRSFLFRNFITDDEAKHIADTAWPRMERSTVVGPNGSSVLDNYRTSYGTFVNRYETKVISRVQDRVALFTRMPVLHQEDMQVLRYGIGQYYHQHTDSLPNDVAGPRVATVLIYLADAEEGGETSFPYDSVWANPKMAELFAPTLSACAKGHVAFRPKRGDAVLFYSIHPDGKTEDMHSTHEGCAVVKGAKWTTTIWIHAKPFRPEEWNGKSFRRGGQDSIDPGICRDLLAGACPAWAADGQCEHNSEYMHVQCPSSCNVCEPCTAADKEALAPCYWRNRVKKNFLAFDQSELTYTVAEGAR